MVSHNILAFSVGLLGLFLVVCAGLRVKFANSSG